MTTALALVETAQPLASLKALRDDAETYAAGSRSQATRRAYATDMLHFRSWCNVHAVVALPASGAVVALYLTDCAKTYALATINRRIAAINREHRKAGLPSPFLNPHVQDVWKGVRRALGAKQDAKAPVLIDDLRRIVASMSHSTIDIRDRAVLLLGFGGAFRRSEISGFDVIDIRFVAHGAEVTLKRSKTDQEGEGRLVGIPYGSRLSTCPVRALQEWIERAGLVDGPLFRAVDRGGKVARTRLADQSVATIVKRHVARAGLDPAEYAGHSLRSGFATTAALAGVGLAEIALQTGHKTLEMVRRYVRPATIWHGNPAERVGL